MALGHRRAGKPTHTNGLADSSFHENNHQREAQLGDAADASDLAAFLGELKKRGSQLDDLLTAWDYTTLNSRLPTSSWPPVQPEVEDITSLRMAYEECKRSCHTIANKPGHRSHAHCDDLGFLLGTAFLAVQDPEEQARGARLMQDLSGEDHLYPDAMCAYGACLNDGRGVEPADPEAAVQVWSTAARDHGHTQAQYELGVAYYTGEGAPEDEEGAVALFREAGEKGHAGAMFMLGDCLLEGVGVPRNRMAALDWLKLAGDRGHRGARSRYLALLEPGGPQANGAFTDSSRLTLIRRRTTVSKSKA
uniref:Uncharacterized protein n=1 Tax=Octactis speculum TaxID=3111310 RepID=A0A7S2CU34_9STRA